MAPSGAICLRGKVWDDLFTLLGRPDDVGPPLILGGWWCTTDEEKKQRFDDHIAFAIRTQKAEEVATFLKKLSEDAWYFIESN